MYNTILMRIFFGGPLTELKDPDKTKAFYKKLADVATKNGYDYFWAFLHGTDPIKNPDVSPDAVYKADTSELAKSDMMVAYMGEPSDGTGIEIEFARDHHIPVYILYEKGRHISRMLLGDPAVKGKIEFTGEEDALTQFDSLISQLPH